MPADEQGYSKRMNSMPKHVVSRTLDEVGWTNSTLIKGEVSEEVSRLKGQPGQDILVLGSRELVNDLLQYALVDELRLMVFPVVLGTGKHLFEDGIGTRLRLVESRSFESGVVLLRYQPIS
jgi:dihydrofolate reductase